MKQKMDIEIAKDFMMRLVWEDFSEVFAVDMLIYLFNSISQLSMESKTGAADFCDDLARFIYSDMSNHGEETRRKYTNNIDERIRTFGYNVCDKEGEREKIKREIYGQKEEAEEVLDLSKHSTKEDECLDLAKHLSAVISNDQTPPAISRQIKTALTERNAKIKQFTPEKIAETLCLE